MPQERQDEWLEQWTLFKDDERFLFEDWIFPNTLQGFHDLIVLEAGCGGGQHTSFVAPYAKKIVSIDLNSIAIAKSRNSSSHNVHFIEADIAEIDLDDKFDIVFSIGVVHHTDNPDITVENLTRHVRPGGRLILWVYSKEGNWISEHIVERARRMFLGKTNARGLDRLARFLTVALYLPIYSIYLLPLRFLPYYEYFENFRLLSFERNVLNVFDKLNAPQVEYIHRERVQQWFQESRFENIHISHYKGVSWRASGTLRE